MVRIAGAIELESDIEHFGVFHRISALEVNSRLPECKLSLANTVRMRERAD